MHLRPYTIGFTAVNNQHPTHTLHLWEGSNLAIKGVANVDRPFPLVRKGEFTASSDRCGPNGIEALPGLTLPPLTTNCDADMLAKGPKGGLAARILHEEFDAVVNAPDQIEAIFSQFEPSVEVVRNAEARVHEYQAKSNYAS